MWHVRCHNYPARACAKRGEAGLSNGSVSQSVSVCQSVCHQNFGLITTTKGLNTSKRHSNNDNSEKIVHGTIVQ